VFGTKLNYDSHFFVNGEEISGIDSIEIGYQNSANVTKPLGYHGGVVTVGGPTQQSLSVSRYLISNTPLESFSNGQKFTGSLNYEGGSYGFNSGYITDVSVNCAVGAIPRTNYNFVVYDELTGVDASGTQTSDIYIPSQGSISITCDNVSTNRVLGFDYRVESPIKPYYTIGSENPAEVKYVGPNTYTASVQLEVDDVFPESGYTFLTSGKDGRGGKFNQTNVILSVNGRDGTNIKNYPIPSPVLVGEQLSASADGSLRLTLNYIGHM
tara:strand:- start:77 stop:880 length:804 start_codon:yes stop_codon:yes gene_type:complete